MQNIQLFFFAYFIENYTDFSYAVCPVLLNKVFFSSWQYDDQREISKKIGLSTVEFVIPCHSMLLVSRFCLLVRNVSRICFVNVCVCTICTLCIHLALTVILLYRGLYKIPHLSVFLDLFSSSGFQ